MVDVLSVLTIYFNSRPSARGDIIHHWYILLVFISIHAPPRGATLITATSAHGKDFNSRPSARGDPQSNERLKPEEISIHAPPRGATRAERRKAARDIFQFTPLREGRRRGGRIMRIPF